MLLTERSLRVPFDPKGGDVLDALARGIAARLAADEAPIRIAVTASDARHLDCEIGVLSAPAASPSASPDSIFEFRKRRYENTKAVNAALVVPTGIGAEVGGHAGDAGAVARLLGAACDEIVVHPNVVNAADLNEMPGNALYVEGSVLSRLLMGTVGLARVRSNRVLLVIDRHPDRCFEELAVNCASAARVNMGLDCPEVLQLEEPLEMSAHYSPAGRAIGRVGDLSTLLGLLRERAGRHDAVAITSRIEVPSHYHSDYFKMTGEEMVNPWGGVEAMLSHALSALLDVPTAHSPMMSSRDVRSLELGMVDPRKAADTFSTTYLHCILKGLQRSPRIVAGARPGDPGLFTAADVSCLVIPDGCIGLPTLAALRQGIPVIAVRGNRNRMQNDLTRLPFAPGQLVFVDGYLEAAGVLTALRAGIAPSTVKRPLDPTRVERPCR